MFSIFNANTLRPLPLPFPERVVTLENWRTGQWEAYDDFIVLREQNTSFDAMAAFSWPQDSELSLKGSSHQIEAIYTSHELFDLLGVTPRVGRFFSVDHESPAASGVTVLSYELWQRLFHADPNILGQSVVVENQVHTVIGIMEPDVTIPYAHMDLWIPVTQDLSGELRQIIGRLKPGIGQTRALQDLLRVKGTPADQASVHVEDRLGLTLMQTEYTREFRNETLCYLLSVALILLITCCNVSGLFLARGAYRTRELGIRSALGATRAQLMRQVLTESLVVSSLGTVAGLLLSLWSRSVLCAWLDWLVPSWASFAWDSRQTCFCLGMVLGVTLLSGVLPAWHAREQRHLRLLLKSGGHWASASRRHCRSLNAIVIGEIALALTLLTGAGLLLRSYHEMKHTDPGYRVKHVFMYQLYAYGATGGGDTDECYAYFLGHLEKVRRVPGIENAAITLKTPLWGGGSDGRIIAAGGREMPAGQEPEILRYPVTPGYLDTMGITLLAGRCFRDRDIHAGAEKTVIINKSLADFYWPQQNPLGQRLRFTEKKNWHRVVGVTQDIRYEGLDRPLRMALYQPYTPQSCGQGIMTVVLHSSIPIEGVLNPIRQILQEASPDASAPGIRALIDLTRRELRNRQTNSLPYYLFAVIGIALAISGLYGVVSYSVSQRTQEVGIRMALGARSGDIIKQVLLQNLRLIGVGLAFGLGGGLAFGRILSAHLFGVGFLDPVTYAGVAGLLTGVALLACIIPARRAAKVDPMEALRYE